MMLTDFQVRRAVRQIDRIIDVLKLKLNGTSILTEAGSNYFIFTPLIAYKAGAEKIYVWIKDTSYGTAKEIYTEFIRILQVLNIDQSIFEFGLNTRPPDHIQQADIITNLGSVRPLDKTLIGTLKKGAVISYMCEAWEIRPQDVDIEYCKSAGVKIAGVWENHPDLMIFNGCGPLAVKLCYEAGLEVYQNKILIVSGDKFGQTAAKAFEQTGAAEVRQITPAEVAATDLSYFDFVFVADYSFPGEIFGASTSEQLGGLKNNMVIHLCGCVDYTYLTANGIECYPKQTGHPFRMTRTLAHLGSKPVIELHAAGLKVGECLYRGKENNLIQPI